MPIGFYPVTMVGKDPLTTWVDMFEVLHGFIVYGLAINGYTKHHPILRSKQLSAVGPIYISLKKFWKGRGLSSVHLGSSSHVPFISWEGRSQPFGTALIRTPAAKSELGIWFLPLRRLQQLQPAQDIHDAGHDGMKHEVMVTHKKLCFNLQKKSKQAKVQNNFNHPFGKLLGSLIIFDDAHRS